MASKCEICNNESTKLKKLGDIKLCDDCYQRLVSMMKYKNFEDIVYEDKTLLMKFCNKLIIMIE